MRQSLDTPLRKHRVLSKIAVINAELFVVDSHFTKRNFLRIQPLQQRLVFRAVEGAV